MLHPSTQNATGRVPLTKAGTDLSADELHSILQLRTAVFVVEQDCPYQEVDGFDLRADTWHRWWNGRDTVEQTGGGTVEVDVGIVAYLRVLSELDRFRIGRVVTRADRRGRGLSAALVADTVRWLIAGQDGARKTVVLSAQSHLVEFYRQLGFSATGSEFTEDGIAHVPMALSLSTESTKSYGSL